MPGGARRGEGGARGRSKGVAVSMEDRGQGQEEGEEDTVGDMEASRKCLEKEDSGEDPVAGGQKVTSIT